jgi:hypothetical protein
LTRFPVGAVGGRGQLVPGGRLRVEGGAGVGDEPEGVAAEDEVGRWLFGLHDGEQCAAGLGGIAELLTVHVETAFADSTP